MKRTGWITFSCLVLMCSCGSQGLQQETDPTQSVQQAQSSCMPITTCNNAGATCGTASDGCGGTLNCGSCPSGQVCTNNNCYSATCQAFTCGPNSCGCSGDGCGGTLCCGGCAVGAYCNVPICAQLCNDCAAMEVVTTSFQPCTNGVCNMGEGNANESSRSAPRRSTA